MPLFGSGNNLLVSMLSLGHRDSLLTSNSLLENGDSLLVANTLLESSDSLVSRRRKNTTINLIADAFFNILGMFYYNSSSSNDYNNLYLYYNITISSEMNVRDIIFLRTYFYNEFGYRIYFDSTSHIISDQYDINNTLLFPFGNKKFSASLGINISSQFWKHYEYITNEDGESEKVLQSSFLSPSTTLYSGGISFDFWDQSAINFSIASAQKTKIKNQALFDEQGTEFLYGLEKGQKRKYFFGFSLSLQITQQKIFKNFYFENMTEAFIQADRYQAFKYTTVNMRNAFHYLFFSHFRLSFQTELQYDVDAIGVKPYIVNQLMFGVYFNNQL